MKPEDPRIDQIVSLVVDRLKKQSAGGHAPSPTAHHSTAPAVHVHRRGVFDDVETAVAAGRRAFEQYEKMPLETRRAVVKSMRDAALGVLEEMCQRAVAETRLGRVEDKRIKNRVAITRTPGPEFLEPVAASGDHGLMVMERAPFGVIASITPCTNPTETIINNGIGMVAGGNAVVFNVHPLAKETSAWYISLLADAAVAAGGPENLLCCVASPTIESAQNLMRHKGIRLVVVTGGGAVVQEAMRSGKRAISAGPGNPPAVVDETAHLEAAARGIVAGASFDNNVICTDEKEIVVVAQVADKLKKHLKECATHELSAGEVRALERVLITADNHVNRDFVGKSANVLLRAIGKSAGDDLRLLWAEVDEQHPFVQHELLMPLVGLVRVKDVDEAIACAKRVEHGFGHTATMWSTNIENLSSMARQINTSIFVKNGPNYAGIGVGGEGWTSWTIASPTGEGLTTCRTFTRERRCTLTDYFRIV
ncbi:MAG: aldehyde dehydrogenase EutE [Deltaproteobacteria bacterium]|nr:aldehyde dehydrogenase EutE [Deltaproteobacteria bacterium]